MLRGAAERMLWGTPAGNGEVLDGDATPAHVVERNRRNAAGSTGPRTVGGEARSRRNSLKHGLCANPAAGVVEEPERFRAFRGRTRGRPTLTGSAVPGFEA